MQKFSYHTHTNTFDVYDGNNSAKEMVERAEEIGYTELGISNHFSYHHNMLPIYPMYFNDIKIFEDTMLRTVDCIREDTINAGIKVYVGFEVDFFTSPRWLDAFERIKEKLNADYYIGSCHFLVDNDAEKIHSFYYPSKYDKALTPKFVQNGLENYWINMVAAIESGYFDFIAHLDVYKLFERFRKFECMEGRLKAIEAFGKFKMPYELNTSGFTKCGEQHPCKWMMNELNKRDVPIVISDDAHHISSLGAHYDKAEKLLESLNYKHRWSMKK